MSQIDGAGGVSTLTAFFDTRDEAQDAVDRLVDAGIAQSNIRLVEGSSKATSTTTQPSEHKGFFESLADFFMPDEDRFSYAEGLSRGGYLVTVTAVPADSYELALDILDDEGAIDLDERQKEWQGSGWTGYQAEDLAEAGSTGKAKASGFETASTSSDETIPVVQEELRIGKRDVSLGRVRVRSYVVEEPVNEQVSLSQERVVLERRPVDRALNANDAAFEDRTIEAEEHAEEAVVSKTARVTEEIGLRKESEQRQETISDTVRRTEVEVEDERELNERGTGTLSLGKGDKTPGRRR